MFGNVVRFARRGLIKVLRLMRYELDDLIGWHSTDGTKRERS